jgi:chromate transporter
MIRGSALLALLAVFAPLSFTTIGGGQSVVSEIHRQSVLHYHWLDEEGFVTLFALSRLAPGPGSLLVTLIGWVVAGWQGALVASIAIFLPSSLLLYGLAQLWARNRGAHWQRAIERGLAPIAAGLILAAALTLVQASEGGPYAWVVAALSTLVLSTTRVSPFILLGMGAAAFLALGVA